MCALLLSLLFVTCCMLPSRDSAHNPSHNEGRPDGKLSAISVIYTFKPNLFFFDQNSAFLVHRGLTDNWV